MEANQLLYQRLISGQTAESLTTCRAVNTVLRFLPSVDVDVSVCVRAARASECVVVI